MSRGDVFLFIAVLAVVGIADSAYLAWEWYEAASAAWCDFGSFFSCTTVRESPYSALAGIPIGWVGVAGFGILLALVVLAFRGIEMLGPWTIERWILVLAIAGAAVGVLLTLVEVFVVQAVCVLCALGFLLDLGILAAVALMPRSDS